MESDNSSMDGEVDTHWRESLDTKDASEEPFSGKGPKSPPENNDLEATSPVSSQGSPQSRSPLGFNSDTKPPHTPGSGPNENGEPNGDHDADDRLSLSPPHGDQPQSPENRGSRSPSPTSCPTQNHQSPPDGTTSPARSPGGSPVANHVHSPADKDGEDGVDTTHQVNKSLAEDLSDVSDIESEGGDDDILNAEEDEEEEKRDSDGGGKRGRSKMNGGVTMSLAVTEEEQLDFDEDPTEEANLVGGPGVVEREEGEEEDGDPVGDRAAIGGGGGDVGEKRGGGGVKKEEEELEEGEVSDEGESRPEENEPRPICRFYSRGACTWGSSCRFLHPGVTDKGHYTMFDMVRPLAAPAPPHHAAPYHPGASMRPVDPYGPPAMLDPRVPGAGAGLMRAPPGKDELGAGPVGPGAAAPVTESAWERGLRQAKEILKKSTKRKETEVDFEEKKMNLTLGQDELDKENDYYTRSASPALSPSPERVLPVPRTKTPGHPHYLPHGEDYLPPHGHPGAVDPYYRAPIHHVDPYYMHHRPLHPTHHPYDDPHRVYARPRYGAPHPDYYGHPGAPPPREGHLPPHHDLVYEPSSRGPPGGKPSSSSASRHAKPAREVIVQRVEKSAPHRVVPEYEGPPSAASMPGERGPRGGSFERGGMPSRRESPPVRRSRADEWADPWMRSKSPGRERDGRGGGGDGREGREGGGGGKSGVRRGKRSSESSYSSSSSRSSSSRSSYSSYSDSRSRSRSPRGGSRRPPPPSRSSKPPIQFKLSPSSRNKPLPSRGKPASPPSVRMSNKLAKLPFAAASPAENKRGAPSSTGGVPPRLLAQAKATVKEALRFSSRRRGSSRSRSSSASSSASSSSSSSSSEEDSSSGDSSSGSATPPPRGTKKGAPAPVSKKAATAAPPSGGSGRAKTPLSPPKKKSSGSGAGADLNKLAKAGIKLNLAADKAAVSSKKRPAPVDASPNKTPPPPSKKSSSGGVPSRREELLKQLKAVEDAIARKRSKI